MGKIRVGDGNMVKKVNEKEFKELSDKGLSVVDFSTTWCGPCQMLAPIMEQLSDEMPEVAFYNIDTDENQDIAMELEIRSIPAIHIFKDGKSVASTVGFQPNEMIKAFIEENK